MLIIHPPADPDRAVAAVLAAMQDERLSFRARGLLGLLLSRSGERWPHETLHSFAVAISDRQKALSGRIPGQGQAAIVAVLRELEEAGYLTRRLVGNGVHPQVCIEIIDTPGVWETVPMQEDRDADAKVYLIGQHGSSIAKIGTTASLQNRLRSLQSGYPLKLEILWHKRGGWGLERYLHGVFADRRIEGEWFDFGDEDPRDAVSDAAALRPSRDGSGPG
ncbi:GIY-YIG nuclease family protein [Streptomyces sp. NPDC001815]|uniref:GIY-YIG nuclease family protein n=1 Tax=Streptomyces sp. NPDC001815 TaxID=3154526 RepID=UPI00332CFD1F